MQNMCTSNIITFHYSTVLFAQCSHVCRELIYFYRLTAARKVFKSKKSNFLETIQENWIDGKKTPCKNLSTIRSLLSHDSFFFPRPRFIHYLRRFKCRMCKRTEIHSKKERRQNKHVSICKFFRIIAIYSINIRSVHECVFNLLESTWNSNIILT